MTSDGAFRCRVNNKDKNTQGAEINFNPPKGEDKAYNDREGKPEDRVLFAFISIFYKISQFLFAA
jgi:hypothetical protein